MININKYRQTSLDFRRLFSNMLRMDHTDGKLPLIRLKRFMDENEIIRELIQNVIKQSKYDYKTDFIINNGSSSWKLINPPEDESDHIKAIYDYMSDICNSEGDLAGIARGFYYSVGYQKWDDILKIFLEKAFKPINDFIVDSLSKEIILLEGDKMRSGIVQNIENNYGTANIANRDICSVNTTTAADITEICKIIDTLRPLIIKSNMDEGEKENLIDDLDVIQEQIVSKEPKVSRIKKAYQNIKTFLSKAPAAIAEGSTIITKSQDLVEKVKSFINTVF